MFDYGLQLTRQLLLNLQRSLDQAYGQLHRRLTIQLYQVSIGDDLPSQANDLALQQSLVRL